MARFDVFRHPNPRASHGLLLDAQSDLVTTATRWCVPLLQAGPGLPVLQGAQVVLLLHGTPWLLDTPNVLAVPAGLLRGPMLRLAGDDALRVESALDFMLRGY